MSDGSPRAILFTQQIVGGMNRKTGMIFWAEALARRGFDTFVVTTQLSWLSYLRANPRLRTIERSDLNRWRDRGERLHNFIWLPILHPASVSAPLLRQISVPFFSLYPWLLPVAVREVVAGADLIVIESCAAVLLFDRLKRIAPSYARFVYCSSDRLRAVGMHPMLEQTLRRTAPSYDLVRVPAQAMAEDFPNGTPVAFIPHGIEKELFDEAADDPFEGPGPHAVVAGDMLFDEESFATLLDAFPEVCFHAFGRMKLDALADRANLQIHGEVPFADLVPRLLYADVGIAPYLDRPEVHYVAQSSLKLIQYQYCRLPTVAPRFAAAGRANVVGYDPRDSGSIIAAFAAALALDRATLDASAVTEWDTVIDRVLGGAGLQHRATA
jgi:2-beta-glucuronyltransferase